MIIRKIVFNILALVFNRIPRNKHLWLTGKVASWDYINDPPAFFDNSKYFFLYMVHQTDEKVYWITSSEKEYELLKSMNLPVIRFQSIKGIYLTLRAKYFFHHYGTDQIDHRLQYGSIQINFWHAMPFKKMRFSIVPRVDCHKRFLSDSIEYALSSSEFLTDTVMTEMYALPKKRILDFGFPRQDIFKLDKGECKEFCVKYSRNLLKYIELSEKFESVLLYMPTWRDDDPDYFTKLGIDYKRLSEELKKIGGVLFIKLHPLTRNVKLGDHDNIIQIDNAVDIYPLLRYVNYLITDYSSICYDYLLLDKEMIFIPYDKEKYLSMRGIYFDYDSVTPGVKYYSFDEFISNISNLYLLDYSKERYELKKKFFDDYNYDACERTYQYFKQKG